MEKTSWKVVGVNFHQGHSDLFPFWCARRQCLCNCLVALCKQLRMTCELSTHREIDEVVTSLMTGMLFKHLLSHAT